MQFFVRTKYAGIMMLAAVFSATAFSQTTPRSPGELAWAIHYDPKTFDPAKVDEQSSDTVRFLTAGVLLRVNRQTGEPEPELAETWTVSKDGRVISFHLRKGLRFSDGSELTSADVAWSLRRVLAPATGAPVAAEFLSPQQVTVEAPAPLSITVKLPVRVIGVAKLFDEIAIEPENRPSQGKVTSGPFTVDVYKPEQFLRLKRNPNYWKRDARGVQLPYLTSIRLDVLNNREQEISLFQRGVYDLIDGLPPEYYHLLSEKNPASVKDLGPSLNTEQLWFNESSSAALPDYEKVWFQNRAFRVAISMAIHRTDLARIAYDGHATPAYSSISPANTRWYNVHVRFPHEDVAAASRLLTANGFHVTGAQLYDAGGHPVKFSILTNAGNSARQKMATLIQQDLATLGIKVSVVTLDFPALIDRLMHTQNYQACLLGLSNVETDPNAMMNVWLSSSPNHQWNPSEKVPATPWEAEIDTQMRVQASALLDKDRKIAVDQVQQIVADQQPFIYLVYPNELFAISPRLVGIRPATVQPDLIWNIATIHTKDMQQ